MAKNLLELWGDFLTGVVTQLATWGALGEDRKTLPKIHVTGLDDELVGMAAWSFVLWTIGHTKGAGMTPDMHRRLVEKIAELNIEFAASVKAASKDLP